MSERRRCRIVRSYMEDYPSEVIIEDCSHEEAKSHCSDPSTRSSTCTNVEGIRRTEEKGPWIDHWYWNGEEDEEDEEGGE